MANEISPIWNLVEVLRQIVAKRDIRILELEKQLMESERQRTEQQNYMRWKMRELDQANARIRDMGWQLNPDRMGS